jgi:small acid-soluble spore protein (thioredoxin-like protein)
MRDKPKPDDRSDNADRIQKNITMTIENMRRADETIKKTSDEKTKKELKDKNKRRQDALKGMRSEIRDEALYNRQESEKTNRDNEYVADLYDNK